MHLTEFISLLLHELKVNAGIEKFQHNVRDCCQTPKNDLSPKREYFVLSHKIIPVHELPKQSSSACKGHYKQ